jgi:DNA-binding LytR/AlgR family response regulator
MPHIDGKSLAAELRKPDSLFFLVFVTDFEREVFDTIKYKINAFIPKNESSENYIERLTEVFNSYKNQNPNYECFEVEGSKYPNDIIRVALSDVLYFSYYRKIITVHTTKGEWILKEKVLSKVEEKYLKKSFFKIAREVIVNLARISDIRDLYIELDTGAKLEISRRSRKPVYDAFSDFITEQVK